MRRCEVLKDRWYFRRGSSDPFDFRPEDPGWKAVTLPHDWAIEGPFDGWYEPKFKTDPEQGVIFSPGGDTGALPYIGCGVYVRDLFIPETERGRQFRLEFDGVMSHSEVWINGHSVARQSYGYISFACDITPFLHYGEEPNRITVRAENPPYLSRWYPGAGIYREVRLLSLPPRHFAYSGIRLETLRLDCARRTAFLRVTAEGFAPEELRTTVCRNDKTVAAGGAEWM